MTFLKTAEVLGKSLDFLTWPWIDVRMDVRTDGWMDGAFTHSLKNFPIMGKFVFDTHFDVN